MTDDGLDALPWRTIRGEGFNAHLGPVEIARRGGNGGDDAWIGRLDLDPRHINVGGVCHGGVLMSLADITMGTATYEAGGGHPCATIEMDCHFLAAAKRGQRLLAVATQLRRVRGLSFMECRLEAGGRPVMRASGLWKYLDSRAPGQSGP
ncbi:MAG: PaaI family thioesterase [Paracoccaceae bacterium]